MELEHGYLKVLNLTDNSGVYILELKAIKDFTISNKKFNDKVFLKGYHYYFGSAQKNLSQRVFRHTQKEKVKHWHIDYLTTNVNILIERVFIFKGLSKIYECILAEKLLNNFETQHTIANFGNSDCSKCKSHLWYSVNQLNYSHLCSLYQSTVLFIPSSKDIC